MSAEDLLREAQALADGLKRKTELIEEAVRLADAAHDERLGYRARMALLPAANWSGDVDKMLVAFAWCVAKYEDGGAGKYSTWQILWYSKWAALEAPRFPSVSRARIAQILDDMEARYRAENASLRPVYQQRHYAAVELGDLGDAQRFYDKWWSERRDANADCLACEESARLDWALTSGDDAGAVDVAESIYARRLSCAEVPHRVYGLTLVPLLRLGRVDDAVDAHRAGIRMIGRIEHNMAMDVSRHALFLALTGNFTSALRVLNRVLPQAAAHRMPSTRANVLADAAVAAALLCAGGKRGAKLALDLVDDVTADARGRVDLADFERAAWKKALDIGAKYDARNGNRSFTAGLEKKRALMAFAVDAPLAPRSPRT